jgi:hypothetical protein
MSQNTIKKSMLLFTLAVAAMGAGCSQASDTQPTSTAPDAGVPTDSVQPTTPTPDMNPAPTVPAVNVREKQQPLQHSSHLSNVRVWSCGFLD